MTHGSVTVELRDGDAVVTRADASIRLVPEVLAGDAVDVVVTLAGQVSYRITDWDAATATFGAERTGPRLTG